MSIGPPGYTPDETGLSQGSPQADPSVQYEVKSVRALRGRESPTKAKWHNQGWEFVSENRGTLRTELNFRRVKPKSVGDYLLGSVAGFRRLQPKTQKALVVSCALILIAGIVGIGVGTQGGDDAPEPGSVQPTASSASSADQPVEGIAATGKEREAAAPSDPAGRPTLTADSSDEFASLLAVSDHCERANATFVAEYSGRTIEFDGSIAAMMNHGDYDTRYDILVAPGNKGPESTVGPAFKFEDVNVFDLGLTGSRIPSHVGEGDRFRFVAEVVDYNPTSCLLMLEPVSTGVR